jgi:hypothetical protein
VLHYPVTAFNSARPLRLRTFNMPILRYVEMTLPYFLDGSPFGGG